jgi:uncharacterized membrane-anchored protein
MTNSDFTGKGQPGSLLEPKNWAGGVVPGATNLYRAIARGRTTSALQRRNAALLRIALAILLFGIAGAAIAAPPEKGSVAAMLETPDQVLTYALRQSIGAPARADIGDQATVRLTEGLMIVPREPASRLLVVTRTPVPPDFQALLLGSEGMDAPGIVRFVPAGFIDSDAALTWSPEDFLASLRDTVEHRNADRVKNGLQEREARRWIQPPRYNPETHQLSWAALVLPKSAPRESDGEITYHGIGFGRDGYIEVTAVTSTEKARQIGKVVDEFLQGLNFRSGKAYADTQPSDRRAPAGLAGAMGLDSVHKETSKDSFWSTDKVFPIVGGIVAAIGALSLFIYVQRHLRREARRG